MVDVCHRLLIITTDECRIAHDYKILQGGATKLPKSLPLSHRLINKLGLGKIASLSFDQGFSKIESRELLEACMPDTEVAMLRIGKLKALAAAINLNLILCVSAPQVGGQDTEFFAVFCYCSTGNLNVFFA